MLTAIIVPQIEFDCKCFCIKFVYIFVMFLCYNIHKSRRMYEQKEVLPCVKLNWMP